MWRQSSCICPIQLIAYEGHGIKLVLSTSTAAAKVDMAVHSLGGTIVPAAYQGSADSSRDDKLKRSIALLEEALELIDELKDHPEAGARLSALIEELKANSD